MTLTAADLMTGEVLVAEAGWSVARLTEFLVEHHISGAPVVDADRLLVGVVSLTDIARSAGARSRRWHAPHAFDPEVYGPALVYGTMARAEVDPSLIVRDIMTPRVCDVPASATPREIADAMLRAHIHRIFVTESGMVIGVITAFDMLRALRS